MKNLFFACVGAIVTSIWALGCGQSPEQPSVSDEKMARVMADLYIAEAATVGLVGYPKDSLTQVYFNQVFQIHGISPQEYEKNLQILAQEDQHIEKVVSRSVELVNKEKEKTELNPNAVERGIN